MCSPGQACGLFDSGRRVHLLDITHANVFSRRPVVFRERLKDCGHVGVKLERFVVLDWDVVDQQFTAIKIKYPKKDMS